MTARAAGRGVARLGGAFLLGSVPFAEYVARRAAGADLREVGNGTVSASAVYRVAGLRPFLLVALLDLGKGAAAVLPARRSGPATVAATAAVVVGHNWSPLLGGAGGRGVLPALGALAVAQPSGAALLAGGIAAGHVRGDTAPGCFAAQVLLTPFLALTDGRRGALLGAATAVPMLVKRLVGDRGVRSPASASTYLARAVYDREHRKHHASTTAPAPAAASRAHGGSST